MSEIYYFPNFPLELCTPAYVLFEDNPVKEVILKGLNKLKKDIEINGLGDPLIGDIRNDRNGQPCLITVVGIRRWTCLNKLGYITAPLLIKCNKKNPVIEKVKTLKYKKMKNFADIVKLFRNKDVPGILVVRRWFAWDVDNVIDLTD